MGVQRGQILTPDKKNVLIKEIETEINNLNTSLNQEKVADQVASLFNDFKDKLQDALNVLFEKKGVVTPQETDEILNTIEDAKRSRLQSNYLRGTKRTTLYILGILIVAAGIYYYMKNQKK